jgi:hypothetical protein
LRCALGSADCKREHIHDVPSLRVWAERSAIPLFGARESGAQAETAAEVESEEVEDPSVRFFLFPPAQSGDGAEEDVVAMQRTATHLGER